MHETPGFKIEDITTPDASFWMNGLVTIYRFIQGWGRTRRSSILRPHDVPQLIPDEEACCETELCGYAISPTSYNAWKFKHENSL
jgi:hypothetical protein